MDAKATGGTKSIKEENAMQVKFIRPRSGNHGRRSVLRTVNNVPSVGDSVKWTDEMPFTVTAIEYNLNVTPGLKVAGKASAVVTLE